MIQIFLSATMTKKEKQNDDLLSTVHFRLSPEDTVLLDACAKIDGLPRSAYVRKIILSHIHSELAGKSISATEKCVRKTMENILEVKIKKELLRLNSEIQRANFMQLKSYIMDNPDLDVDDYKSYYYQNDKDSFELTSGKRSFENIIKNMEDRHTADADKPDWLKTLSGEDD